VGYGNGNSDLENERKVRLSVFQFHHVICQFFYSRALCCVLRDVVVLIHTKQHEEKRETTKFERKN
jgi:hypothetical protein